MRYNHLFQCSTALPVIVMALMLSGSRSAQAEIDTGQAVFRAPGNGNSPDNLGQLYEILGHEITPVRIFPKTPVSGTSKRANDAAKNSYTGDKQPAGSPTRPMSGLLKVAVEPSQAAVFIDSVRIPLDELKTGVRVNAGFHTVTAVIEGYEGFYTSLTMEPNATQTVLISLKRVEKETGYLHIYSYPWADIWLDDSSRGSSPTPKPLPLSVGAHALTLKRNGYHPWSETVRIDKDKVVRLNIQMEKQLYKSC